MTYSALLAFAGALLCGGLAIWVLYQAPRAFVHRTFAVGMLVLALREACVGLSVQAIQPVDVIHWERLGLAVAAVLPGSWLLFSLSFARANYRDLVTRWRWFALATFAFPLVLVTLFWSALYADTLRLETFSVWVLPLGWSGYVLYGFVLLSAVIILRHLERTLRASAGSMRWQSKFMILGLGSMWAAQLYTSSQALLFSAVQMTTASFNSAVIIVADALIIVSLVRDRLLGADIYLSQTALYGSLTTLIVGIYLLAVGVLAKAIGYFGGNRALSLGTLFVFLALVGLTMVLLSDQLRHEVKRYISRHFYRPHYDYRQVWTAFTQRTTSVVDIKELCAVVARMVSEIFGVPAVTIWLLEEEERLVLGGSTAGSETQARSAGFAEQGAADLLCHLREQQMPVDVALLSGARAEGRRPPPADFLRQAQIRYGVRLVAGQQWLGVMTLSARQTREPFGWEDFDLLKTLADQAAASLLNRQLAQHLLRAKQLEAFQTLSACFAHDLKNLAAKLSLTVQNLPAHYDNPAFRDDALRVISGSVAKMHAMCSRLSLLTRQLELHRTETDLNEVVRATLADLNGALKVPLCYDLRPVPRFVVDPEQLQKVLVNLLLNANEVVDSHGEIQVTTERLDGWAVLAVRDTGCGMSQEFIARSLFQPFQTTKSQGLGIGLFHSKMIVEAHQGRIEVESEEGKGSTFRILLPVSC